MSLTETYSRVRTGKNLSDMFRIKEWFETRNAPSPLFFNFALEYAITKVHVNQDGLKLHVTHQLLVYAYDVNTRWFNGKPGLFVYRAFIANTEIIILLLFNIGPF